MNKKCYRCGKRKDTVKVETEDNGYNGLLLCDVCRKKIEKERNCDHFNARIEGYEIAGYCTCPDCGAVLCLSEIINLLLDKIREAIKQKGKDKSGNANPV